MVEYGETVKARIPSQLLQQAREKSEATGITISFVIRQALERWVKDEPTYSFDNMTDDELIALARALNQSPFTEDLKFITLVCTEIDRRRQENEDQEK